MIAVDLFAGAGGFTEGAEQAGVKVCWAANHWPLAVQTHAANHPAVEHVCQDLRQADWTQLPQYELLLASPACQGHSEASQPKRRPYHDEMRAAAWGVVDCADVTEPRALIVENVPEFREWRLYPLWVEALRRIGYRVTEHILVASRYNVPQRRRRLFVVGLKRRPFWLPESARPEPSIGPCIEWDTGDWRPVANASPGAQRRIVRAQQRLGPRCLSQHVTGHPGVGLHEPIRTVTTKDQWVVVDGRQYRPLTIRENARAMGFRDSYWWPQAPRRELVTLHGNAVPPPVARELVAAVMEAA